MDLEATTPVGQLTHGAENSELRGVPFAGAVDDNGLQIQLRGKPLSFSF